jgi:hypothetical protein
MINKIYLLVGGLLVLCVAVFLIWRKKEKFGSKKEPYMSAGAMDHLDSLDSNYELVQAPETAVPAAHFADLVDSGDQAQIVQQPPAGESMKPLDRLESLQGKSMIPLTAAHLSPYNVDVANINTYAFAVNAPRVVLKNRLNMEADPYRGDIPIRYHPDVPLIAKSQYGRDSIRLDGYFSDYFSALYNKQTGRAYKNMPIKVATQGTILDYMGDQ